MQENNPTKNTFKLEGVVQRISPLESGNKNGKEWHKLEILIAQQNGNYINKFLLTTWNDKAKSVSEKICINDILSVNVIVGSREYNDKYYPQLTFYNYEILLSNKNTNNNDDAVFDPYTTNNTDIVSEFTNTEDVYDDDVPF